MPVGGQDDKTIAQRLTMVAGGQGLILNPDWVEVAATGSEVEEVLHASALQTLHIPKKYWGLSISRRGGFLL